MNENHRPSDHTPKWRPSGQIVNEVQEFDMTRSLTIHEQLESLGIHDLENARSLTVDVPVFNVCVIIR